MNQGRVYPEQYQALLAEKAEQLKSLLGDFELPPLEVFPSPPRHYRLRAEFRVWHEGDDIFYAMFAPGDKRQPLRIDSCPMVSERIENTMFELLEVIRGNPVLRRKLFQVDFLSTLSGELLVTLLYHRPLGDDWQQAARPLRERFGIDIIGRSRKTKLVMDRDFVVERFKLGERELLYKQVENSFTQPNGEINRAMLGWALDATAGRGGDLLELYCGNANFSIALAPNFRRVLATELAKSSVRAAEDNIRANGIENLTVARLSSEEFSQAMAKVRPFRRLQHIDLDSYAFSTVLVDPPRAGLDAGTEALVQQYPAIVYISCNPETLRHNLAGLTQTHRIARLALFDQFPYTDHKECGVLLVRND
ncbi:tRNA (uridine(54)-C5)-methyltransferase TrmA [Motiliproteus sp. SC1-56]|uniref:tRNA (uridine(54)-C5)-methyltransferase TrmA n=1 Tax=Motiliproteus sp. SC1-56 TaxID=2799565 RepID=UPI001A90BBD6|nr:tRNA (uridine(54)-C5)-methyltransferase TrmA [Motiliproteus sp. SC1-56]